MTDIKVLRARDLWASIVLFFLSLFFLYKTLGFSQDDSITRIDWYNSAALVPTLLLLALLTLSIILFCIAIRERIVMQALRLSGLGLDSKELVRVTALSITLFFYIFSLLPRVDFIIASGLVVLSLVYGYHRATIKRIVGSAVIVSISGLYAIIQHFPQSEWGKPHDDDLVALAAWVLLVILYWYGQRSTKNSRTLVQCLPIAISVLVPLVLVCVMAFGFKQNVPNRGGLIFSVIEYHYYVSFKPFLMR